MKKKITAILFIGVIALIWMGFRSQSRADGYSNGSKIEVVKGEVFKTDNDKFWDLVTFGVTGLKNGYAIVEIEIIDKQGRSISLEADFDGKKKGVSWYSINLEGFEIQHNFTLEVHVGWSDLSTQAAKPNYPDETILIVKYP